MLDLLHWPPVGNRRHLAYGCPPACDLDDGPGASVAACIHEAGHAVLAAAAGRMARDVWVAGETGRASYRVSCPPAPSPRWWAAYHWDELVISVGGQAAETMAANPFDPSPLPPDWPQFPFEEFGPPGLIDGPFNGFEPLALWPAGAGDDRDIAWLHARELLSIPPAVLAAAVPGLDLGRVVFAPDPRAELVRSADAAARLVLVARWGEVEVVAAALHAWPGHRLTGADVRALVGGR